MSINFNTSPTGPSSFNNSNSGADKSKLDVVKTEQKQEISDTASIKPEIEQASLSINQLSSSNSTQDIPVYDSNGDPTGESVTQVDGDNSPPEGTVWVRDSDGNVIGAVPMENDQSCVNINDTSYVYVISDDGTPTQMVEADGENMPEGVVPVYSTDGSVMEATEGPYGDNLTPPEGTVWVRDSDGNVIGAVPMENDQSYVNINDTSYVYVISDDGTPTQMVEADGENMPEGVVPVYSTDGSVMEATEGPYGDNLTPPNGTVWVSDSDGNVIGAVPMENDQSYVNINDTSYVYVISDDGTPTQMVEADAQYMPEGVVPVYSTDGSVMEATDAPYGDNLTPPNGTVWVSDSDGNVIGAVPMGNEPPIVTINETDYVYVIDDNGTPTQMVEADAQYMPEGVVPVYSTDGSVMEATDAPYGDNLTPPNGTVWVSDSDGNVIGAVPMGNEPPIVTINETDYVYVIDDNGTPTQMVEADAQYMPEGVVPVYSTDGSVMEATDAPYGDNLTPPNGTVWVSDSDGNVIGAVPMGNEPPIVTINETDYVYVIDDNGTPTQMVEADAQYMPEGVVPVYSTDGSVMEATDAPYGDNLTPPNGTVWVSDSDGNVIGAVPMGNEPPIVTINETDYVYVIDDNGTPTQMVEADAQYMPEGVVPVYSTDGSVMEATDAPYGDNLTPPNGTVWVSDSDGNVIGAVPVDSSPETIDIDGESYIYNSELGVYEPINNTPDEPVDPTDPELPTGSDGNSDAFDNNSSQTIDITLLENMGYGFAAAKAFNSLDNLSEIGSLRDLRGELSDNNKFIKSLNERVGVQEDSKMKKVATGIVSGSAYAGASATGSTVNTVGALSSSSISAGGIVESVRNTIVKRNRFNAQNESLKSIQDDLESFQSTDLKYKIEGLYAEKGSRRGTGTALGAFNSALHASTLALSFAGIPLPLNLGTLVSDTFAQTRKNIMVERHLSDQGELINSDSKPKSFFAATKSLAKKWWNREIIKKDDPHSNKGVIPSAARLLFTPVQLTGRLVNGVIRSVSNTVAGILTLVPRSMELLVRNQCGPIELYRRFTGSVLILLMMLNGQMLYLMVCLFQ